MNDNVIEEVKIINEKNDIFGTYSKAQAICDFLELEENKELISKNNLIAIYGPWGIGKSCLMQTIKNNLDKNLFEIEWFDTWKYERDNNLPYSLLKFISKNRFWDKLTDSVTSIYSTFKSFSKGIEVELGIPNVINFTLKPGEIIETAENEMNKYNKIIDKETCLWQQINEFEEKFRTIQLTKDINRRLVVFLDDLDRCDSENIITLISSIKLLLSVNPNIIFIIGIDRKAVESALRNKYHNDYNKADEYLEKIFPITFEISNTLQNENFIGYIKEITELDENSSKKIIEFLYNMDFCNARHIKKVFRKYYLIKKYLESKGFDLSNRYNVILVLYNIILNIYYSNEYYYLILENKEKIYENITLYSIDSKQIRNDYSFLGYKNVCNYYLKYSNDFYNIYEILIRFSSYELKKSEMIINIVYNGECYFEKDNWQALFNKSICKNFIDFILTNDGFLKTFYNEQNEYKKDFIYDLIREVNNII